MKQKNQAKEEKKSCDVCSIRVKIGEINGQLKKVTANLMKQNEFRA